jgi:predicted alpha/beta hydrolase family esterase
MDIAEAGRELSRFDSRSWLADLKVPAAVVVTTEDHTVPPRKQRELAAALHAALFEAPIDHLEVTSRPQRYNPALLQAIFCVQDRSGTVNDGSLRATADAVGYA